MDIDPAAVELAIANTKDKIEELQEGLSVLEKAAEFLRAYPNLLSSSNGLKKRVHREERTSRPAPLFERIKPAEEQDLKGKTLIQAADINFDGNGNEWLSPDEIVQIALSRGYRSSHPKNKDNDPTKLARSIRMMMERFPDRYERSEGKFRRRK